MGHKIAIIGGSGLYSLEGMEILKEHEVKTPFGTPSSSIVEAMIKETHFLFLPRHGKKHHLLPHEVNYRANIFALKSMGVKYITSVSAVGSLKEEFAPGLMVLPDQFIDWTKGLRERSFFGNGVAAHVTTAWPISLNLRGLISEACELADVKHALGGAYVCIEGPQFSTRAESNIYRSFGADIIGMTNVPEAYLAAEAGIAYATLGMVTDYDCWKEEHCSLEEIMKVMKGNNIKARKILLELIPLIAASDFEFTPENRNAILTADEDISPENKKIIDILMS